jgi:hypothetical protein
MADFCHAPTTNLTQHNPHGPDDTPKTIDYHHLDIMAKDDEMDEHGIDWIIGCHLVGFWLSSWANHGRFLSHPNHKSYSTQPTWAR